MSSNQKNVLIFIRIAICLVLYTQLNIFSVSGIGVFLPSMFCQNTFKFDKIRILSLLYQVIIFFNICILFLKNYKSGDYYL